MFNIVLLITLFHKAIQFSSFIVYLILQILYNLIIPIDLAMQPLFYYFISPFLV